VAGPGRPKTGGRSKGGLNKRTIALRMGVVDAGAPLALAAKPPRQLPLDFLLDAMNNEDLPIATRIDAARAAAPYTHFRKGLVDTSGRDVPQVINIIRFSDMADEPETLGRPTKPGPVTIEHDPPPASH
jgi:hypothetical protein